MYFPHGDQETLWASLQTTGKCCHKRGIGSMTHPQQSITRLSVVYPYVVLHPVPLGDSQITHIGRVRVSCDWHLRLQRTSLTYHW